MLSTSQDLLYICVLISSNLIVILPNSRNKAHFFLAAVYTFYMGQMALKETVSPCSSVILYGILGLLYNDGCDLVRD